MNTREGAEIFAFPAISIAFEGSKTRILAGMRPSVSAKRFLVFASSQIKTVSASFPMNAFSNSFASGIFRLSILMSGLRAATASSNAAAIGEIERPVDGSSSCGLGTIGAVLVVLRFGLRHFASSRSRFEKLRCDRAL